MDFLTSYDYLVDALETVYGVEPVRNHPRNLRPDVELPAIGVGIVNLDEEESPTIGEDWNFSPMYEIGFFATDEQALLNMLTLFSGLMDELSANYFNTSLNTSQRILNDEAIEALEYAFTFIIKMEQ